jgi:predicted nucleic acid-binding Zn ribbon protein
MSQPPARDPAAPEPAQPSLLCAACGALITGKFCSHCGAPAEAGECPACRAPLSPGARFCHRCGAPVRATARSSRERLGWIVAGIAVLVVGIVLLWRSGSFRPTAPPEMGNPGNAGNPGAAPGLSGPAPDISNMSPQERFDRLFDRVVRAGENGDTLTVRQFAPMALGAYAMLDSASGDLRFHAALIHLAVGDLASAQALADTVLAEAPGHLFAYLIRGEAADRQNDTTALNRSYRDFLAHFDAEMRAGRKEYAEHKPILDDFRVRAEASRARP